MTTIKIAIDASVKGLYRIENTHSFIRRLPPQLFTNYLQILPNSIIVLWKLVAAESTVAMNMWSSLIKLILLAAINWREISARQHKMKELAVFDAATTTQTGNYVVTISRNLVTEIPYQNATFAVGQTKAVPNPSKPYSSLSALQWRWRSDDVSQLRDSIRKYPDLYSKAELCRLWPYEAFEEEANLIGVGYTQTGFCYWTTKNDSTPNMTPTFKPLCMDAITNGIYHVTALLLTAKSSADPERRILLFDEGSTNMRFEIPNGNQNECIKSVPGAYKANLVDFESLSEDHKRIPELQDLATHHEHSMIESITYSAPNLYYARGLRLFSPNVNFARFGGSDISMPKGLLSMDRREYNVEAMELYTVDGGQASATTYLHVAGVQWVNHKTELKPYYSRCILRNGETFAQTDGNSRGTPLNNNKCSSSSLNEYVMPADFVYYDMNQCRKLIVFYQYAYRTFEPSDDLSSSGSDYNKNPIHVVDWMDFLLKAVLFYQGRFYFFTLTNRVLIEMEPKSKTCKPELLQEIGRTEEFLASDFILRSMKNIGKFPGSNVDLKTFQLPKNRFDPYGYITYSTSREGKMENVSLSASDLPKEIPENLLISETTTGNIPPIQVDKKNPYTAVAMVAVPLGILVIIIGCCCFIYTRATSASKDGPRGPARPSSPQESLKKGLKSSMTGMPTYRSDLLSASPSSPEKQSSVSNATKLVTGPATKGADRSPPSSSGMKAEPSSGKKKSASPLAKSKSAKKSRRRSPRPKRP